ncbi:MAG: DUF4175 family protein [Alphaproteobacteria bacterium]|nr:DUF4175 family protein [Alphaproteobacteria bacterium]
MARSVAPQHRDVNAADALPAPDGLTGATARTRRATTAAMDAPLPPARLPDSVRRRLLPGAALLWIERAWAAGWLQGLAAAWALWIVLALMGVTGALPGVLRVALAGALVTGSLAALGLAAARVPLPDRDAVLRRLEAASGVRRGTLAVLDAPALDLADPMAARLWGRALADAPLRLRLGLPRLQLDDGARWGALPLLATGLLLGLLLAKGDAPARIAGSLSPWPTPLSAARVTLTVTPPAWADAAPRTIAIQPGATQPLTALAGSSLRLRGEGLDGPWTLAAPGATARELRGGVGVVRVTRAGRLTLMAGARRVAAIDLSLAADAVPTIAFDGAPQVTPQGALRVAWRLTEDQGPATVWLELRKGGERRAVRLAADARAGTGAAFADLTPDPLAGEVVALRLLARDGAGQTGFSPTVAARLPERRFVHPVAREIIAARKLLIRQPRAREAVADRLTGVAGRPDRFGTNLAAWIAVRGATFRLAYDRDEPRGASIVRLLWDAAVDLEDSGASRAMESLRAAMEEMRRAMASGDERAQRAAADRLAQAMADYLSRQIEGMQARGELTPGQTLDTSFLDAMMADIRDRLAAGDEAGARAALADLQRLMESLQFGGAGDPRLAERAAAAAAAAQSARDIAARQRVLQADTIAEAIRRAVNGAQGPLTSEAARQAQLRDQAAAIGAAARTAGLPPPPALGEAATAMRAAGEALRAGDTAAAARAQERAALALAEAGQAMEAQAQALRRQAGGAGLAQPGAPGSGIDPLGRPGQGFGGGAVRLPDPAGQARLQAIRRLLEERAADPNRSADERAYYLRLLKRF